MIIEHQKRTGDHIPTRITQFPTNLHRSKPPAFTFHEAVRLEKRTRRNAIICSVTTFPFDIDKFSSSWSSYNNLFKRTVSISTLLAAIESVSALLAAVEATLLAANGALAATGALGFNKNFTLAVSLLTSLLATPPVITITIIPTPPIFPGAHGAIVAARTATVATRSRACYSGRIALRQALGTASNASTTALLASLLATPASFLATPPIPIVATPPIVAVPAALLAALFASTTVPFATFWRWWGAFLNANFFTHLTAALLASVS